MGTFGIYALILVSGILQAFGNPMNGQLKNYLQNPWLASLVSFAIIVPVFIFLFAAFPRPLPSAQSIQSMAWWAPFGGVVGAVAVAAGLIFVGEIGAGALAGILISANLITSIAIDHFGWLGVEQHSASLGRLVGALLMIAGVVSITAF